MTRPILLTLGLVIAVVACSKNDPVDNRAARAGAARPDVKASAPTSIGEPHVDTAPARPLPSPAAKIPAMMHGRWALAPADCTSTRGDAKGLLVITPDDLRFYESHAVPAADIHADSGSIAGNFAFTGEGQSWTKYETLKVDKQLLVRTEINPTVSFSYAKCS
jgi:hypothetical protein